MLKNKIKLSLVDDYVKLVIFENFFNNYYGFNSNELAVKVEQTHRLKNLYDVIFEKLSMNDCSLLLLKQQLKQSNHMFKIYTAQTEQDVISKLHDCINKIEQNLQFKLAKLKIDVGDLVKSCFTLKT